MTIIIDTGMIGFLIERNSSQTIDLTLIFPSGIEKLYPHMSGFCSQLFLKLTKNPVLVKF